MNGGAVDLVVIGAGPAGLASATLAAKLGLSVALLDEQERPGGQIYRAPAAGIAEKLGPDYARGAALTAAFAASGAAHLTGAQVWQIEDGKTVYFTRNGAAQRIEARQLVIAVGALERPVPIPGWTLPGVLTVGAAQILMKTGGNVPEAPLVIAGSGPLPLLYASQLLAFGVRPDLVLDTTPPGAIRRALPHVGGALANWRYLVKGLGYLRALRAAGVEIVRGIEAVEAIGDDRLTTVRYRVNGSVSERPARVLLLHEGVVPNIHVTRALGCEHRFDARQRCLVPVLDDWGRSSLDTVLVAGDAAGISGARAAEEAGRLAALAAAERLGRIDAAERDRRAAPIRAELAGHTRIRPFLDALYAPRRAVEVPADGVLVCRCEQVSAKKVREAVALGCLGPTQVKSFTRCGMGPCQGRECALTLANVVADARGVPVGDVGYLRFRPPLKPLTLGELASLADEATEVKA